MNIEQHLQEAAERVEARLSALTDTTFDEYPSLTAAIRYSLLSGGKRIRPYLTLAFCDLFGGNPSAALDFGCALEMIHTYSLIHDDLPCMDDDALRRGKPTNHVVYGEATAVLAGDALLTEAFSVVTTADISAEVSTAAVRLLAQAAGMHGMIGGQMIDLRGEEDRLDFDALLEMHAKKTGALIRAACLLGCLSAGITDPTDIRYQAAITYASNIGLAFQVIDDRLDAIGSVEELGKPIGSDKEQGKTTFLSFMTADQAYDYARDLTDQAKDAVALFAGREKLVDLADLLLNRTH
ncbi:MAG: polyprenyl synthetase family protein [Clostridia bacterium]|nr:polyprenyl synthetase family protein [Clostridia bacterium]